MENAMSIGRILALRLWQYDYFLVRFPTRCIDFLDNRQLSASGQNIKLNYRNS